MSKDQLMAEIVKLSPQERQDLWEVFWALERKAILDRSNPGPQEKALLEAEWQDYLRHPDEGVPFEEALARLRANS